MSDSELTEVKSSTVPVYLTALFAGNLAMTMQICLTRIAAYNFGSDSSTIAAMVVAALSGLATGATLVGRFTDASHLYSRILATTFCLAGLMSAVVAFLSDEIAAVIHSINQTHKVSAAVFALVTLFPLNILFGLILPILVKRADPKAFGIVYGMETIGAAFGAVLAAFVWIQHFGLFRLMIGCSVSALAFAIYYLFETSSFRGISDSHTRDEIEKSKANRIPILIVVAFTSCASLGMEVVWQRYFVVWFGSDTKSFAIVVAAILAGISFGAMIASKLISWSSNYYLLYRCSLLAMAIGIVGSTHAIIECFDNLESLKSSLSWLSDSPIVSRLLVALGLLFVPTTLFGFGLPLAAALWVEDKQNIVRSVGQLYSAAAIGNILGVALSGYLLIPSLGLRATTVMLSVLCVLGCVVVFCIERIQCSKNSKPLKWISVTVFFMVGLWVFFTNSILSKPALLGLGNQLVGWEVDYYSEYSTSTVAVIHETANPAHRKMLIDGVAIGESLGGVDQKQQLLAHLPFLLSQPDSDSKRQRVLTIGLGSGILAGELARSSPDRQIFCAEISPAVIEAAGYFSEQNGDLFQQPNFHLIRGDGIAFLRDQNEYFDVIVSDAKSRPGHAGNVAFFSRDYYEICDERLTDDGVFVQWVSLKSSESAIATILKTFCGVFPFGHVGIVAPDSIFAVGSKTEINLDREHISNYLNEPYSQRLRNYDFASFDDILSMYWLDQTRIEVELENISVNSFDHPVLESFALNSFKQSTRKSSIQLNLIRQLLDREMTDGFQTSRLNGAPIDAIEHASLLKDIISGRRAGHAVIDANQLILELESDWLDNAAQAYKKALEFLPGLNRQRQVARIYRQLAEKAKGESKINLQYSALLNIRELNASTAGDEFEMAEILYSLGRKENALEHYYQAVKKEPNNYPYRNAFAFCLLSLGKSMQAASQFKRILAKSEDSEARIGLGISQMLSGLREAGVDNIRQAIEADANLESKLMEYQIENW